MAEFPTPPALAARAEAGSLSVDCTLADGGEQSEYLFALWDWPKIDFQRYRRIRVAVTDTKNERHSVTVERIAIAGEPMSQHHIREAVEQALDLFDSRHPPIAEWLMSVIHGRGLRIDGGAVKRPPRIDLRPAVQEFVTRYKTGDQGEVYLLCRAKDKEAKAIVRAYWSAAGVDSEYWGKPEDWRIPKPSKESASTDRG